LISAAGLALL